MEKVLSRNRFFRDFGTLWPCWADLKFRPPKSTSKKWKSKNSQKSKNRSKIHKKHPILAYEYSKCSGGYFWPFPTYRTLKTVFANFLQPKYVFSAIFDPKTSIFKSTKRCQSVKKSRKSQNGVYTVFRAQKSPGIDCETQKNDQGTRKWCFQHFLTAAPAILVKKRLFSHIFAYFWCFGNANRRCTGARESKKIKIAKNGSKHSKTII